MGLFPVFAQPLGARTDGQVPVAAHLQALVQGFGRLVVKRVGRAAFFLGPDQGLVGVGESHAAEVRHGVGLDPDDVIQYPKAQVLEDGPHPEDVVVGADDPQGAGALEDTAAGCQPVVGKSVIGFKILKPVPFVVHGLDAGEIRPPELLAKLQIVRGIGENQVHRFGRKRIQYAEAVARDDLIEG